MLLKLNVHKTLKQILEMRIDRKKAESIATTYTKTGDEIDYKKFEIFITYTKA